jgi:hypothetical protein
VSADSVWQIGERRVTTILDVHIKSSSVYGSNCHIPIITTGHSGWQTIADGSHAVFLML